MRAAKSRPGPVRKADVMSGLPWPIVSRVAVVQWGRTYAEALRHICRQAFPKAEITAYQRAGDVLTALRAQPVNLLLQTLVFPDMDGLELLNCVTREKLAGRVVVASRRRDEQCLFALRNARFDGIVDSLDGSAETLVKALRQVAAGQAYVSPVFRDLIVERSVPSKLWHQFTPAEISVLTVIGDGSDDQEAAVLLDLSALTVQTHRRNIMRKLGVRTSAKLVREAVRLGMVQITPEGRVIRPRVGQDLYPDLPPTGTLT